MVKYWIENARTVYVHDSCANKRRAIYLAAPVEQWAKEVKEVFHALQEHDGDLSMSEYWDNKVRRLLANWPVKEDA